MGGTRAGSCYLAQSLHRCLLWAMSTILHEPRMNDIQVLVSSLLGMVLLGVFLWLRSRRAESTNRDTIRTASNRP